MSTGARLRRGRFWLADRVRGGLDRGHYNEIRAVMAGRRPTGDALEQLLDHASSTTAFYAPYAGHGLSSFPVIDKAVLKQDQNGFRSSIFASATLPTRKTSESTGEPFMVVQDPCKRERSIADTIVFNEMAGHRLGERLMWLFAARLLPMSRWQRFSRNIITVDHVGLDQARAADIVEALRHDHVNATLGISSTYQVLARYLEKQGPSRQGLGVNVVIATGENLLAEVKERLEAAFGCPVVNRYSTEEHGMLACGRPGHDRLYLNRASYHFEFLRLDSDEPQAPGELARVVITDLYNRAMPMIRFDTGDLAITAEPDERGDITALLRIEGRRADVIYDTSGGQMSSPSASAIIAKSFPAVQQYQLVQTGRITYRLTAATGEAHYREVDLAAELRRWLGQDAQITVELVDSIPRLPSGKHRPVICEYEPEPEETAPEG